MGVCVCVCVKKSTNLKKINKATKKKDLFKCNYSHGKECLLKKTKESNELVPLNSKTAGGRGHLLLLKFTLTSLQSGEVWGTAARVLALVKSPPFLSPCLWFPLSFPGCSLHSQEKSGKITPREKSAQELAVQSGPGQQPHQGPHQTPHLAALAGPTPWSHLTLAPSMLHLSCSPLPNLFLLWWEVWEHLKNLFKPINNKAGKRKRRKSHQKTNEPNDKKSTYVF